MANSRMRSGLAVAGIAGACLSLNALPAAAEEALSPQCVQFTCQQSFKRCTAGGVMSTVTVGANAAIQGCPATVTVWYEGKSSVTPFPYYSCGCRPPDVTKITK